MTKKRMKEQRRNAVIEWFHSLNSVINESVQSSILFCLNTTLMLKVSLMLYKRTL